MEILVGILAFAVAVLAVIQGWQMKQSKHNRHNPEISTKFDIIIAQLGRMEQRLNDIWDKVKE